MQSIILHRVSIRYPRLKYRKFMAHDYFSRVVCILVAHCRQALGLVEVSRSIRSRLARASETRHVQRETPMRVTLALMMMTFLWAPVAHGTVVEYTNKLSWQSATGGYDTITFTELPANTWITTQYAHLGETFTDGSHQVAYMPGAFVNDDYGLTGALDETTLEFSQPMYAIAADFPGLLTFQLYFQNQLIYQSTDFGGGGAGWFAGLVSDRPFDRVRMYDPTSDFFIDDLHFGPAIPGPGALALAAIAGALTSRRRR